MRARVRSLDCMATGMKQLLHMGIVAAALAFVRPNADVDLKAAMHKEQVQAISRARSMPTPQD